MPRRDSDLTAWVNVIYGCNEKCTYCVVPYTRGEEQSRRPEDIRREMMGLGEAGEPGCVRVLRAARELCRLCCAEALGRGEFFVLHLPCGSHAA